MVEGSVRRPGRDKDAVAAVILWRAQEIEVEGQIYDKMRDGDVNSSRRQEVCERAVALSASGYSCWIRPGYYFPFVLLHLFLLVWLDG